MREGPRSGDSLSGGLVTRFRRAREAAGVVLVRQRHDSPRTARERPRSCTCSAQRHPSRIPRSRGSSVHQRALVAARASPGPSAGGAPDLHRTLSQSTPPRPARGRDPDARLTPAGSGCMRRTRGMPGRADPGAASQPRALPPPVRTSPDRPFGCGLSQGQERPAGIKQSSHSTFCHLPPGGPPCLLSGLLTIIFSHLAKETPAESSVKKRGDMRMVW